MNGIIGSKRKSIPNMGTPNQIATKHTGRSKRPKSTSSSFPNLPSSPIPTSPQDGVSFLNATYKVDPNPHHENPNGLASPASDSRYDTSSKPSYSRPRPNFDEMKDGYATSASITSRHQVYPSPFATHGTPKKSSSSIAYSFGTPIRSAPAQRGANKKVTYNWTNGNVTKAPYNLSDCKIRSRSGLKNIVYDVYREIEEGNILADDLRRLDVKVALPGTKNLIPVAVQPLKLIDNLIFTQPIVEKNIPGKTAEENKDLKLHLCQEIVRQLYTGTTGCYIPFDITPANIGFQIDDKNNITAVKIYDWTLPSDMLNGDIPIELNTHFISNLEMPPKDSAAIGQNCLAAIDYQKWPSRATAASSSSAGTSSQPTYEEQSFMEFLTAHQEKVKGFCTTVTDCNFSWLKCEFNFNYLVSSRKESAREFILKNKRD